VSRATRWSPYLVAVVCAALYLLDAPHTSDLAAQTARGQLFSRSGFVPYWSGWYSGIPTASYSLLTPPLLGVLRPVVVGALSILAVGATVPALLRDAVRPRAGAIFFVLAATIDVVSGRTTFAVGAALALAAVLAGERRRPVLTCVLAALATAASPVAGVLLLVAAVGFIVSDLPRRRQGLWLGAGVVVVLGAIAILSRGGTTGYEPLSRVSLLTACATTLVVLAAPVGHRVRAGALATIGLLVLAFFVHSPVGANATRIAILGAAPTVAAAARLGRRSLVIALALASLLPLIQLHDDLSASAHHFDTKRAFVAPLLTRLAADPITRDHRLELVDTATHWPSTYLLPDEMLARGWERQTDEARNPLFYGRAPITAATYRAFLDANAVGAVAVAKGVGLDYGAVTEDRLIAAGLPYLHQIWTDSHWTLYDVAAPTPIVSAPAHVVSHTDTGVTIDAPAAGSYALRLRWSPYLVVAGGSVSRTADGNVMVRLSAGGSYQLHAVWRIP
jgi:hypothetical protein